MSSPVSDAFDGDLDGALRYALIDDFCEYWALRQIAHAIKGPGQEAAREVDRRLIAWIEAGDVLAGLPRQGKGFDPWPLSAAQAARKVREAIDALDRSPNIGDVGWFTWREDDDL